MSLIKKQDAYRRGVDAEGLAAEMLRGKGYEILEMRYKTRFGEVDIVARDGDSIVFAEVKARKNKADGLYAVDAKTRARIQNAALLYMSERAEYADFGMRFDVITVSEDPNETLKEVGAISVSHLDNAWMAGA